MTQTERSAAAGESLLGSRYGAVTLSILSLITIIAFETMAVSTAMPQVTRELDAGPAYGLVFSLMFTGQLLGIVVAGAWAEARGPMGALWAGLAGFAAGSLVAGLAPSFVILLAGRLLAGLGGGLAVVAVYVIIGAAYPLALRPAVFGWVSAAWVLPSVAGPLVAAALTAVLGWRSVFLLIAPLVGLTAFGVRRVGRLLAAGPGPDYHPDADADGRPQQLPWLRLVGYGVAMTAGAAAFQAGTSFPALHPAAACALAVVGLALLGLGVPPLVPRGTLLMRRGQPSVMLTRFLLMAAFNGTVAFVPLMLVERRGQSLLATGVLLALASIGWAAGSFLQSRPAMAGRGPELVASGTSLLVAAAATLCLLDLAHWPVWSIAVALSGFGLAMGVGVTSTSVLALELAPPGGHAAASASLQVADVLGSVMGIAAISGLYAAATALRWDASVVFPLLWASTTALALVCVPASRRIRRGANSSSL